MNPYQILNIPESSTVDEAKKAYRKLAAKYHPDNKETGNENKFKEVTQAFKMIESPSPEENHTQWGGNPFGNPFGMPGFGGMGFRQMKMIQFSELETELDLTFKESILGCQRSITLNRYVECSSCHGQGQFLTIDKCSACKGKGAKSVQTRGNMTIMQQCPKCNGSGQESSICLGCKGNGAIQKESTYSVSIPGGVLDQEKIGMPGAGHFFNSPLGAGYDRAFVKVNVAKDPDMSLEGADVVSEVTISLLQALEGTKIKVRTVHGDKDLTIPALTKNKDQVLLPGLGASSFNVTGQKGDHIFNLKVIYPQQTDKLITVLKEGNNV